MTRAFLCAVWVLAAGAAWAGDWPQWRGPAGNGSADERGLPESWSATENVQWIVDLPGHSAATPIVAGGRVFVSSTQAGSKDLLALCFGVKDGKPLWQRKVATARILPPASNTPASPSPTTDGKRVYFLYGTGDLAAFDVDGTPRWSRNLAEEYGQLSVKFGYASSPLLYDGKLFIQVLRADKPYEWSGPGEWPTDAFLLALDAATGKDLWKRDRRMGAEGENQDAYSSPILHRAGRRAEVLVAGSDYLTAHDPKSGEEIWRFGYNPAKRPMWRIIPSPVPGDGLVYVPQPRGRGSLFAVPDGRAGEVAASDAAWEWKAEPGGPKPDTPDVCVPLLYRERLYVVGEAPPALSCLDAKTGKVIWRADLERGKPYRASPLGADGKVYCMNEAGAVTVFAAGDEAKVLARFTVDEGPVQASMAAAAGRLFLRTTRRLWCIGR